MLFKATYSHGQVNGMCSLYISHSVPCCFSSLPRATDKLVPHYPDVCESDLWRPKLYVSYTWRGIQVCIQICFPHLVYQGNQYQGVESRQGNPHLVTKYKYPNTYPTVVIIEILGISGCTRVGPSTHGTGRCFLRTMAWWFIGGRLPPGQDLVGCVRRFCLKSTILRI